MAKKVAVSFILDETGSMSVVKDQTISGFNEYIQTLQKDKSAKSMRFTLTKFNSEKREIVHDGVKLEDVELLTPESYQPAAVTPLYDAIGVTINAVGKKLKKNSASPLVIIQTDGQENASKEYTREMIFDLIKEKTDAGWTFVFLGADQDAYAASATIGITMGNTLSYASSDTSETLKQAARGTVAYAAVGHQTTTFWTDAEDEDE